MATFHLQVVSLDGPEFEGEVQSIMLRTIHGDVAILARHINYCTAIGMGMATVIEADGKEHRAACIGGMLSMMNGVCRVLPTTWEWSEEIDVERAQAAMEKAKRRLEETQATKEARIRAEAKLYRAMVRIGVAKR